MVAEPERLYDTLVQFGNAPITGIVNMLWNRAALDEYDAAQTDSAGVSYEQLVKEYTQKRDFREKCSSVPKRKSRCVAWKKALCARRKSMRPNKQKQTPKDPAPVTPKTLLSTDRMSEKPGADV